MNAKQLLEEMASLESRIATIYERFATRFQHAGDVGDLWASMGHEELRHADLLSRAAGRAGEVAVPAETREHVARLERMVTRYEQEQPGIERLQEALRATADLEEAEGELHIALRELGDAARALASDPAMQHQLRGLLDRAIELYGTAELQQRVAWERFRGS